MLMAGELRYSSRVRAERKYVDVGLAEKVLHRISAHCHGLNKEFVKAPDVAEKVIDGLYDGIVDEEVVELIAQTSAYMSHKHPDYSTLAARVTISQLHRMTPGSFSEACELLHACKEGQNRISDEVWSFVSSNANQLDSAVDYSRDFDLDYFGFKTLERSYLARVHGKVVERPQHMFLRVACGIHCGDVASTLETYNFMSNRCFIHASPTLLNAGMSEPQMASCFLLTMKEDTTEGVFETLKNCALISERAGGIGLAFSNLNAMSALAPRFDGQRKGVVPVLKIFNEAMRHANDSAGRRKGGLAAYLEPWHADVLDFLDAKKNYGKEEQRARDLFYALWVPDLFMQRVKDDGEWTLFCPSEACDDITGRSLMDSWGDDFKELYERLEKTCKGRATMQARTLWWRILDAQMETGTPSILYKDAANRKSNQKKLGTVHCSNLCTEIIQYTDASEVAVCTLASISLPSFVVNDPEKRYDFQRLSEATKVVTRNLNKIIDRNFYPIPEAKVSNLRHRPIGVGAQGLADVFIMLGMPFDSQAARTLNEEIFETIYYAACEASCELAEVEGAHESYQGSPASQGLLQFDLWGQECPSSGRWDWRALKKRIAEHGLRNSLLVAAMPTATTAQILGNTESFEPYTQNLYVRRVLAGEFVQVNRHLVNDLLKRGLWNEEIRRQLVAHNGSVQSLPVPEDIKALYKTVWEIKQRVILDMAADRGKYIDQSQSLSIYMADATASKLSSMHFHGWQLGLKTGMYYLRTKAAADAIKFTVDAEARSASKRKYEWLERDEPTMSCDSCSA